MARCISLAKLSRSEVRTNPKVGAVLVHNEKIIGEGRYEYYGGPHAEVNAINSVCSSDQNLISKSTLYVSLEPCNIYGKTPPCSSLILENGITDLVLGCNDPNPKISGSSIELLRKNGVKVTTGILEKECQKLIEAFSINTRNERPEITLKFAQSTDYYISIKGQQTWLTNNYSKILSHQLRANANAILIGTKTAEIDNPSLNVRLFPGHNPLRIVIDRDLKVDGKQNIYQDGLHTLIVTEKKPQNRLKNIEYWTMNFDDALLKNLMSRLYSEKNIGKLIVEGGSKTINHFLSQGLWDKALVLTSSEMISDGIKAPLIEGKLLDQYELDNDRITIIKNPY